MKVYIVFQFKNVVVVLGHTYKKGVYELVNDEHRNKADSESKASFCAIWVKVQDGMKNISKQKSKNVLQAGDTMKTKIMFQSGL